MHALIERLLDPTTPLTPQEVEQIFQAMLGEKLADAQIAAILAAWRLRGEGATELVAGARALRAAAASVPLPETTRPLVDNCGTGGDGSASFNLSTAAAIVASAAGARVAKHGNRSVSSRCGSADLLFAAGLPDTLTPEATGKLLVETGLTFFFAPQFHPTMKAVAPVRRALGVRTIFNLLGPLANPIAPEVQLIGVGTRAYLRPMAEALHQLGIRRALIVHSRDGLDELSPSAPTDAVLVEAPGLTELVIDPKGLGVQAKLGDLAGGDPQENLHLLGRVLNGSAPALAEAVCLNAGAVLWLVGRAATLGEGLSLARTTLASGQAQDHFAHWIHRARLLAGLA